MTLTLETFMDAHRRMQALMPPPQPRVFVSDYLPKGERPVCHIRLAHPWIVWLSKWLPISPWDRFEGVETFDQAFRFNGDLYVTSRTYQEMKRALQ